MPIWSRKKSWRLRLASSTTSKSTSVSRATPQRTSIAATLLPRPPQPRTATWPAASRARTSALGAGPARGGHALTRLPPAGRSRGGRRRAARVLLGVAPVDEDDARLVGQPEHLDDVRDGRAVGEFERARLTPPARRAGSATAMRRVRRRRSCASPSERHATTPRTRLPDGAHEWCRLRVVLRRGPSLRRSRARSRRPCRARRRSP